MPVSLSVSLSAASADGLVTNAGTDSGQPQLSEPFLHKLDHQQRLQGASWPERQKNCRTRAAIDFVGKYIPAFRAEGTSVAVSQGVVLPFCGAQQIPGATT